MYPTHQPVKHSSHAIRVTAECNQECTGNENDQITEEYTRNCARFLERLSNPYKASRTHPHNALLTAQIKGASLMTYSTCFFFMLFSPFLSPLSFVDFRAFVESVVH